MKKKLFVKFWFGKVGHMPGSLNSPIGLFVGWKMGGWNLYRGLMLGNMFLGKWKVGVRTFEPAKN
jgi:hypothetical protein